MKLRSLHFHSLLWLLCFYPLLALGPPAAHQGVPEAGIPWELDRDGLRQWKQVERECATCEGTGKHECERCRGMVDAVCAECDGKRTAVCRSCAGDGKQYDALVEMICPYCDGSALWTCRACHGRGDYGVEGGGKKRQRCSPCKAKGSFRCQVCKGKRHIPVLKVGTKGPGDASSASIDKAFDALLGTMKRLKNYTPTGQETEDSKALEAAIKASKRSLPGLKRVDELVNASMKALRGQAAYVGYEDWVSQEFKLVQLRSSRYVANQLLLLTECQARLDFNAEARKK